MFARSGLVLKEGQMEGSNPNVHIDLVIFGRQSKSPSALETAVVLMQISRRLGIDWVYYTWGFDPDYEPTSPLVIPFNLSVLCRKSSSSQNVRALAGAY